MLSFVSWIAHQQSKSQRWGHWKLRVDYTYWGPLNVVLYWINSERCDFCQKILINSVVDKVYFWAELKGSNQVLSLLKLKTLKLATSTPLLCLYYFLKFLLLHPHPRMPRTLIISQSSPMGWNHLINQVTLKSLWVEVLTLSRGACFSKESTWRGLCLAPRSESAMV